MRLLLSVRTILALILFAVCFAQAGVRLNEFAAASPERLLQRSVGAYPRLGLGVQWQESSFDDSGWLTGPGPFGFGTFLGVTLGTDVSDDLQDRTPGLYLRQAFTVDGATAASSATVELRVRYNDGFVAFLNGVEVARRNLGDRGMFVYHDQTAFNAHPVAATLEIISIGPASSLLVAGDNVLCIQVHNTAVTGVSSAELLLQAELRLSTGPVLAPAGASWKYFPGVIEPTGGPIDYAETIRYLEDRRAVVPWAALTFNDSAWAAGAGPVGIEGANPADYALGVNLHAQAFGITPSIYVRQAFTLDADEAGTGDSVRLSLDYDDGLIVFLNGHEIVRRNVGTAGTRTPFTATAATTHNANGDNQGSVTGQTEVLLLNPASLPLRAGDNVLSLQLHNSSVSSGDSIARVTLETTGAGGRVLVQPAGPVRYFVGVSEPDAGIEQDDTGALDEPPETDTDWIELHNPDPTAVDLTGWSLTDSASNLRKWIFPAGTTLPAGGHLVVLASGLDLTPADGASYIHTNFKLGAEGEYLGLVDASGAIVDEFAPGFPPQFPTQVYGRDATGQWGYLATATAGAPNVGTALAAAPAAPSFSVNGGFHQPFYNLTLSCATPGATIRYTTDGRDPDLVNGAVYIFPLPVATSRIVRARAYLAGAVPSAVVTHTYLIDQSVARRSVPALILGGDPALTYYGPNTASGPSDGQGLFAIKGGVYSGDLWTSNGDTSAFNMPMLRGRASEKPATLEFIPPSGAPLRTDLGLRVAGSPYSRPRYRLTDAASAIFNAGDATRKPSFNLYFRSEFGQRPVAYPFFPDSAVASFYDIRLRAGKNDIANPFIIDELMRRIFIATGQKGSHGIFTTLYLNGVYKGYYNLTEHLREGFMQEHHGGTATWDVQQVNDFSDGDPVHWNKFISYIRNTDLSVPANYQRVHDYLDVDNLIDYLLVNAFAGTWDWPNNNWVAARERTERGRWRFYLWDAEGAFGGQGRSASTYNTLTSDLTLSLATARSTPTDFIPAIYTLLYTSPEFRLRFADRANKQLFNDGALVRTRMTAIYTTLRDTINPLMQDTIGQTVNPAFYNNWIATDTRRTVFLNQLVAQGHWPATTAPVMNPAVGGVVGPGQLVTLTNGNSGGTLYYTVNGVDPRAPGGAVAGSVYSGALSLSATTTVKARVRSAGGEWSALAEATFVVPDSTATFLPTGTADWTADANWSTGPAPYPNGIGRDAVIPASDIERNINLQAPVTIGTIDFPQGASAVRTRIRDRNTGNTLTFHNGAEPAYIHAGGTGVGFVEFENVAGLVLQSQLELVIDNVAGSPDFGGLRLRERITGPGGVTKTGPGAAALTGEFKLFTGPVLVNDGVLLVTGPSVPVNSTVTIVQPGAQLRLTSAGAPRLYPFGGVLTLAGAGRDPSIPETPGVGGRLGALRFQPGTAGNRAVIPTPVTLAGDTSIYVDGATNRIELSGPLSGSATLVMAGAGALTLSADSPAFTGGLQVDAGELEFAARFAAAGPGTVVAGAILRGHGRLGALSGAGALTLDRTFLRTGALGGLTQSFVFGQAGSPDFTVPAASGNAVVAPAGAPLAPIAINLYLDVADPAGQRFRGGYFLPAGASWSSILGAPGLAVYRPDVAGAHSFAGRAWTRLPGAVITRVPHVADLGEGLVAGEILEVRVDADAVTDFGDWRAMAFPVPADFADPAISGPTAAPFGDGLQNLLRYALGVTGPSGAATRLPYLNSGDGLRRFRFPYDPGLVDVTYRVEATDDLSDWSAPDILFDSAIAAPEPDGEGWLEITDSSPLVPRRFYRLRVIRAE